MHQSNLNEAMLSAQVHEWLAEDELTQEELALLPKSFADISRPARHSKPRVLPSILRAAAVIVVFIGALTVLGPRVSAAVLRWFDRGAVPVTPAPASTTPPASPPGTAPISVYKIAPASDVVLIRFAASQRGTLSLHPTSDSLVLLRVRRIGPEIRLVVVPQGFVVENSSEALATYQLELPSSVSWVDVDIGGRRSRVNVAGRGAPQAVSLGTR